MSSPFIAELASSGGYRRTNLKHAETLLLSTSVALWGNKFEDQVSSSEADDDEIVQLADNFIFI